MIIANWKSTVARHLLVSLTAPALLACSIDATSTDEVGSADAPLKLPPGELTPIYKFPPIERPRPFPLPDPEEFLSISAGNAHTCAMKRNGNVYCWGRDDHGQVGMLPNATCKSTPNKCVDRPTRVTGVGFSSASQLDAGDQHACALDPSGQAFCWGDGDQGQVGINGVTGWFFEPLAVSGGLTFTSISAGTRGTCGATAGGMSCWGILPSGAVFGQTQATAPLSIYSATGLAPTGVSMGDAHVCAQWVSGSYRETNCWGRNWEGQTGAAGSQPFSLLGQGPWSIGTDALRVTTQGRFTCADRPGPMGVNVVCWGVGTSGQLGSGVASNTPDPQQVGGIPLGVPAMALTSVTTGQYHACALDPNGAAYCWGYGGWGQLGAGYNASGYADSSITPVAVGGGLRFRAIAAGELHTCAIGVDNHIYCWGSNYNGELGTQYKSSGQPYTNGWVADPVRALDPI